MAGYLHTDDDVAAAWGDWVISTACSSCTTNTDNAFRLWTSTTGSSTTSYTWDLWAQGAANMKAAIANRQNGWIQARHPKVETAEERMARETAEVKRRAEAELRAKAEAEKRLKVKTRAKKLLMDHITKAQRESLEKHGFFELKVGEKIYRIRQGTHGNVRLVENGKETKSFCIQPNGIPDEDAMLAQKLLLENDEASFLRIANATALN